jgi:TolA-binding protein
MLQNRFFPVFVAQEKQKLAQITQPPPVIPPPAVPVTPWQSNSEITQLQQQIQQLQQQIQQQQEQTSGQIKQSEQNLAAQYQSFMSQQQASIALCFFPLGQKPLHTSISPANPDVIKALIIL